jgi:hypothetical protein
MKSNIIDLKSKITFGKYSGKTFDEISDIDPEYILWLDENVKTIKFERSWIDAIQMDIMEDELLTEYDYTERD